MLKSMLKGKLILTTIKLIIILAIVNYVFSNINLDYISSSILEVVNNAKTTFSNATKEEKGLVDREIKEILKDAEALEDTKGKSKQYKKDGGFEQANRDFDSLNPRDIEDIETDYGKGRTGQLLDGRKINVRPGSTNDTQPTLEIINSNKRRIKIRYGK